jgi:cell shape-determining protein MreC
VFLGRVAKVFRRSSLVRLLTDRQSRIEVALRTDRNVRLTGFVRGDGRPPDEEDLAVTHVKIEDGEGWLAPGAVVVTSNADVLVPAGLLVGVVTEVRDANLDGMPTIRVRPAMDLARSTQVLVLGGEAAGSVPAAR